MLIYVYLSMGRFIDKTIVIEYAKHFNCYTIRVLSNTDSSNSVEKMDVFENVKKK